MVEEVGEQDKINSEILIQSIFPAHLKYKGTVSGKPYEWLQAGDVVSVLQEDVEYLLAQKLGSRSCCGYPGEGNVLFKLYS